METEIGWEKKIRKRIEVEDFMEVLAKTVRSFRFFLAAYKLLFEYHLLVWFRIPSSWCPRVLVGTNHLRSPYHVL